MRKNLSAVKQDSSLTLKRAKKLLSKANMILSKQKQILKKKIQPIISKDQKRVIEFEDGILAWIDHDTSLMWEVKNRSNIFIVNSWSQGIRNQARLLNINKYAGFDDWRVPDIEELKTLLGNSKSVNGFYVKKPLTRQTNSLYWSSTSSSVDTSKAWFIDTSLKISGTQNKQSRASFRCVRGPKIWWTTILMRWAYEHYLNYPDIIGKDFPRKFTNCLEMETLDLKYSHLSRLPEKIENLINLKRLHLCGNNLKVLPGNIEKLINLTYLGVEKNSLLRLPREIGNLKKLKYLLICGNNLKELPIEITKLTTLKQLYLYDNDLKYLPKQIKNLNSIWNKLNRFRNTKEQNKILNWLIELKKNGCEIII